MTRVGTLGEIVIDVTGADAERVVAFWCAVLGVEVHERDGRWIDLEPDAPGRPHLGFQVVPEPKARKNRVHLDVTVDHLDTATRDAAELGATVVGDPVREADCRFQVLTDPGGNELCLVEMR